MSDSEAYEEVRISAEGVTVVKRFEEDEFPVPAIAFRVLSERDEAVMVTLVDTVPEDVAVEDLGFHPEYGSEYWTIDDEQITFEREIDANAEYTTVYGIRATGTDDVEKFLTEPRIEEVDPPLPDDADLDDVVPESDDEVVRDVISGESESVPGLDEDESEEDIETLDLKDPNDPGGGSTTAEPTGSDEAADADDAAEATTEDETEAPTEPADVDLEGQSVVARMAAELRQNQVSANDVKLLRQAFEIAGKEGGSIDARLDQLQSDVSDLRAYSSAIEEFLDENGTAQQLIQDLQSDVEGFEADIDDLQSTVGSHESQMTAVSEEVDGVSDEVDSVSTEVANVSEEVTDVSQDVTEVSQEVTDVSEEVTDVSQEVTEVSEETTALSEEVTDVHDEVDEVHEEVDGVSGEIEDVESQLSELESRIDELETAIEEVQEEVPEGEVADRVDSMEDELDDLQVWQEQIKETFGG